MRGDDNARKAARGACRLTDGFSGAGDAEAQCRRDGRGRVIGRPCVLSSRYMPVLRRATTSEARYVCPMRSAYLDSRQGNGDKRCGQRDVAYGAVGELPPVDRYVVSTWTTTSIAGIDCIEPAAEVKESVEYRSPPPS